MHSGCWAVQIGQIHLCFRNHARMARFWAYPPPKKKAQAHMWGRFSEEWMDDGHLFLCTSVDLAPTWKSKWRTPSKSHLVMESLPGPPACKRFFKRIKNNHLSAFFTFPPSSHDPAIQTLWVMLWNRNVEDEWGERMLKAKMHVI